MIRARQAGKVLLALLVMLLNSAFALSGDGKSMIAKKDGEHIIELPAKMKKALERFDREFVLWKEVEFLPTIVKTYKFTANKIPSAVIGDFNGDGTTDVVLFGHNSEYDMLVGILSKGTAFKAVEVWKGGLTNPLKEGLGMGGRVEYGQWKYLTFVPRGEIDWDGEFIHLYTDAYGFEFYEKSSSLGWFVDDQPIGRGGGH